MSSGSSSDSEPSSTPLPKSDLCEAERILRRALHVPEGMVNVMYNPTDMASLAIKLHVERYGAYLARMRRLREVLGLCTRGSGLLVEEGDHSPSTVPAESPVEAEDAKCWTAMLQAFGELAPNRDLPASLQSLRGVVLRPQGGGDRGFLVPPVVLHYGKAMAEIAEMYCEDVAGDFEGSGGSDEWVCRPAEWCVRDCAAAEVRDALCGLGEPVAPMLAIDVNTTSDETLRLVAAYCAALAADHVLLANDNLLDMQCYPVYPVAGGGPTAGGCGSTLPVSTSLPQPFPHLHASMLLPPASYPQLSLLASHKRGAQNIYSSVASYARRVPPVQVTDPFLGNLPNTSDNLSRCAAQFQAFAALLVGGADVSPLVTPLESVFAVEYLLPTTPPPDLAAEVEGAPNGDDSVAVSSRVGILAEVTHLDANCCIIPEKYLPLSECVSEGLEAFGNLLFEGNRISGTEKDCDSWGWQVEPRLGYIPVEVADKYAHLSFPTTAASPAFLPFTVERFMDAAESKAARLREAVESMPRPQNNLMGGKWTAVSIRCSRESLQIAEHRARIPPSGRRTVLDAADRSSLPAPATPPRRTPHQEQSMVVASLARTTDVMKVANFLGLTSLVNLCGLVIAILLRGKSLSEVKALFELISPTK